MFIFYAVVLYITVIIIYYVLSMNSIHIKYFSNNETDYSSLFLKILS